MLWKHTVKDTRHPEILLPEASKNGGFPQQWAYTQLFLCLCSFSHFAVGIAAVWDSASMSHFGSPLLGHSLDTALFGISGIRGGTPLMIDCLNEKNYYKKPLHEMRPLRMVTGSTFLCREEYIVLWNEILEVKYLEEKYLKWPWKY